MSLPSLRRIAPTGLLVGATIVSAAAISETSQGGFHPLLIAACMLPLQCAALVWAWQRKPH